MVEEENETFFIRVWIPLLSRRVLKTLKGSPKRTISANDGLGRLQIVLELDTERCASEEAESLRGWIRDNAQARTLSFKCIFHNSPASLFTFEEWTYVAKSGNDLDTACYGYQTFTYNYDDTILSTFVIRFLDSKRYHTS